MAVMGITAFKERFKDYDDCYTISCFQESQIIILRLNLGLFLFILMMMYQAFQQSC